MAHALARSLPQVLEQTKGTETISVCVDVEVRSRAKH